MLYSSGELYLPLLLFSGVRSLEAYGVETTSSTSPMRTCSYVRLGSN